MKTRSNMPLYVVECEDIKALSNSQIDLLRCGDYLVKKDESGEHAYKVTYKKDGVGMGLTYHDASCVETVSYDYTDGNWVYNSTDKADLPINVEGASFKPIYCHPITVDIDDENYKIHIALLIFDNEETEYNTYSKLTAKLNGILSINSSAVFPTTGSLYYGASGTVYVAQCIKLHYDVLSIMATNVSGNGTQGYFTLNTFTSATIYDGVNKIN